MSVPGCPGEPGPTAAWNGKECLQLRSSFHPFWVERNHLNFLLFKRHRKQVPRLSSLSNPRGDLSSILGGVWSGGTSVCRALLVLPGPCLQHRGGRRGLGVEDHEVSQFRARAGRGEASSGSGGRQALGAATLLFIWQVLLFLLQINVLQLLQNLIHEVLGILLVGHS